VSAARVSLLTLIAEPTNFALEERKSSEASAAARRSAYLFLLIIRVFALKVLRSMTLTIRETLLSLSRAFQYFFRFSSAESKMGMSFGEPSKEGMGLPSVT